MGAPEERAASYVRTTTAARCGLKVRVRGMRPRFIVLTALLAWVSNAGALGEAPATGAPLVLAVHPFLTKAEIVRRFTPTADYLSRALGQPVTVRVGGTYAEHVFAVGHDEVDIAFMGPAVYVRMVNEFGPKPILARWEVNHRSTMTGVIAVPTASPVHALAELRGRRVAFGDPDSTLSYYLQAWLLLKAGVPLSALGEYRFVGSHPNVALAVLAGDFDAGAMLSEVYEEYAPRGLRVLAVTPPAPERLFVARGNAPPELVARLRAVLLSMHESAAGREAMGKLNRGLTRFVPGAEADYQDLKTMMQPLMQRAH